MMGLSELKAAINSENDGVASSERQRIMKWTIDDVMSHVKSLGCVDQAKVFGEEVSFSHWFPGEIFINNKPRLATAAVTLLSFRVSSLQLGNNSFFFCVLLFQLIDGEAFLLLTQNDIVNLLKIKLGPALKIFHTIPKH